MKTKLSQKRLRGLIRTLKHARKLILIGDEDFVCCAIYQARLNQCKLNFFEEVDADSEYLCSWIERMLGGYSVLESWLRNDFSMQGITIQFPPIDQMTILRVRWIDWMIKSLSSELKVKKG